jgi:hypothetical protein
MAYIFHHADFAPSINRQLKRNGVRHFITRIDSECLFVKVDHSTDDRFPNFFRFFSDQRVNHILRTIMGHNNTKNRKRYMYARSRKQIQEFTVPYDDKSCEIDGENLHVVYSIAELNAPIRRDIMGPHGTHLYEKDIPHFGLIYVYRSERTEHDVNGEFRVEHKWLPITTPPDRILNVLRSEAIDDLLGY